MRGRAWLAVLVAALGLAGAAAAARTGAAAPAPATPGSAVSSAWVCPHGGGRGWTADVIVANPGPAAVQARLTAIGGGSPTRLDTLTVDAGAEQIVEVPARARASATAVDVFGGAAAVGWTVKAGGADSGIGAEPCTDAPGVAWSVVDGVTNRQTRSYVIVSNPFASDAVVDVVLYLPDHPPVRDADWTDLRIRAGSSTALDLRRALGEQIVGATVSATRGRVAVASLAVGETAGVRSVLAAPSFATRWIAPVVGGSGAGTLSLLVPGDIGIRFGATQLADDTDAQPAGNLTVARQGGASTASKAIATAGPSGVIVQATGGSVAVGLREAGHGGDGAATGGTTTPSAAWVALPAATGRSATPSVLLVNDGDVEVTVTASRLPDGGGDPGEPTTVTIVPGRTAAVPASWLREDPMAAVLLTGDAPFVAASAGSQGRGGSGGYALAIGVPVSSDATAAP
jgi:hypothetical protein